MRGAGANRKRKPIGQALHQLRHTVEDGLLVAKYLNQSFLPESEEFLDGLRGMMLFDEGLPKDAVGIARKNRESGYRDCRRNPSSCQSSKNDIL